MRTVRLFRFLAQSSRGLILSMICAGVLSGAFSATVLAIISRALHDGGASRWTVVAFVALVAGKIVSTVASQLLLARFSQGSILDLSIELSAKVLGAPLRELEKRGGAQVLTILTDDISSVTWAVQCLPQLAMNLAVIVGCAIYLAWLSWQMFLTAAGITLVGALMYYVLHARAVKVMQAARDARERLLTHFRNLTVGIKELMMHEQRRTEFLRAEVLPAAAEYRRSNLAASTQYALADAWVQILYHGLIGGLLFAYPLLTRPQPAALTGYVFALMYVMSPLWMIIGAVPALARGEVAFTRIEELGFALGSKPASEASPPPAEASVSEELEIQMRQVQFTYDGSTGEHPFTLGPIDFRIGPGELVFVVGGNGSGKSTFVKVLCGLYAPSHGQVRVGATPVSAANLAWYREHFSVVFADCFLFTKLLGLETADLDETARRYLELLQIDHKVDVRDRSFTTTDLSSGQRRRLALVTAYLEDRPCYVFDEWAADQDPEYKEIFYSKLLPDLRDRGKAVIVITHDDRYFHLGTRVIKLDEGRIVEETANSAGPARRSAAW